MIDHFYYLVERDNRINHLFLVTLQKRVVNRNSFNSVLGGPALYTEEHGHPMLRQRHLPFRITNKERDAWLENMLEALTQSRLNKDIQEYLYDRLKLTANHMVNA